MSMLKRMVAPLVLVTALACAGPVLAADPTAHQIYEVFRAGHLEEAQQMINQVLRDHPNSAQAHYIDAQIAAKMANYPQARAELAKAQQLDPSGAFAKPEALAALQRELARSNSAPQGYRTVPYVREQHHSSFSWPIVLLVIAGVVIGWALLSRRNPPQYGGYPNGVPPAGGPGGGYGAPPGYGPAGYGPPMGGSGLGSGIVGGLASGLAIGAGVAAGEELVHHWIDRDGNRVEGPPPPGYVPNPQDDNPSSGGNDFGVSDSSSWDSGGGGGDFGTSDGGGGDNWT